VLMKMNNALFCSASYLFCVMRHARRCLAHVVGALLSARAAHRAQHRETPSRGASAAANAGARNGQKDAHSATLIDVRVSRGGF